MLHVHLIAWLWLVGPLGLCRATQVVLHDRILQRPRDWLMGRPKGNGPARRKPLGELVAYLLGCPWCISLEVALIFVVLLDNRNTQGPALLVLLALALSLCAVVLDRLVDKFTPDELPPPAAPTAPASMAPPQVAEALGGLPIGTGA